MVQSPPRIRAAEREARSQISEQDRLLERVENDRQHPGGDDGDENLRDEGLAHAGDRLKRWPDSARPTVETVGRGLGGVSAGALGDSAGAPGAGKVVLDAEEIRRELKRKGSWQRCGICRSMS